MSSWKRTVKIALLQPSKIGPLRSGLKKFNQGKVRILMYHRVTNELGRSDAPYNAVSIANFDKQMARLASDYNVITLDDLCRCFPDFEALPENSAIITFDDGFRDNYLNAFPILKKYGLNATIYVCSGTVDNGKRLWFDRVSLILNSSKVRTFHFNSESFDFAPDGFFVHYRIHEMMKDYSPEQVNRSIEQLAECVGVDESALESIEGSGMLSWDELREMQESGITIGAHTVSHPILSHLDDEVLQHEMLMCQRVLQNNLGRPVRHFSYPNGQPCDYDERALQIVAKHYDSATTTTAGLTTETSDIYRLPRMHVDDEVELFAGKLELPYLSRSAGSDVITYHDYPA
jgi:peptidoglycan/xylan/chitin deacetylase (PgdA/CDA1 family)